MNPTTYHSLTPGERVQLHDFADIRLDPAIPEDYVRTPAGKHTPVSKFLADARRTARRKKRTQERQNRRIGQRQARQAKK